jgi:flagellar hook assembly protein FlgD
LTPRVFSPSGGFASTSAAISFTLARPASTTVTVFNRAGRRVRSVMSGRPLGTGANLVYWDGRDDAGGVVEDGIYLVGVEALGEVRKRTVAVVR